MNFQDSSPLHKTNGLNFILKKHAQILRIIRKFNQESVFTVCSFDSSFILLFINLLRKIQTKKKVMEAQITESNVAQSTETFIDMLIQEILILNIISNKMTQSQ